MKKIIFLFLLCATHFGFAQQVVVQDFETPSSYNLNIFAGLSGSVVPDPAPGGTRVNSLNLNSSSTGAVFQGCEIIQQTTRFKLTTDKTMSIDVYATQAFTMLAKVEGGSGAPNSGASQSYTTPNSWQTLTFTFTQGLDGTGTADGSYTSLVLFPNWNPNNSGFLTPSDFMLYVDNITCEASPILPDPAPTTAAPTQPGRPAADVKSLFCDVYQPIVENMNYAGVDGQPSNDNTFNTSWCGANTALVQIDGDNTNKITGLGCEGVAFLAGRFDATGFDFFHMDIWTPSPTQDKSFNFKFSNWSGTGGETNAYEYSMTNANILPATNPGTWISIDLPISAFTTVNGGNRTDFTQFVITSNLGTVYYDNVYLHKNTVLGTTSFDVAQVKMFPNPATTNFTLHAKEIIERVSVFNLLGQEVLTVNANDKVVSVDVSNLQIGIYVVRTSINGSEATARFIKE